MINQKSLIQKDSLKTYRHSLVEKTERIVTAVYLVSSLIVDQEPLKWKLRNYSLETLSNAHKGFNTQVVNNLEDIINLLSLAGKSALISQMNVEILDSGIRSLIQNISGFEMVDKDFLMISKQESDSEKDKDVIKNKKDINPNKTNTEVYKGHKSIPKRTSSRKDKRRDMVLQALKNKDESSIKDIVRQVRGCSEKTIQRELNGLISDGLVGKKGERRWSLYFII